MLRDAALVAGKDLTIELRSRVGLNQVAPLAGLVLIVFAFAFDANAALLDQGAPGLFWVSVLFAGLLIVQRSFTLEAADGNRDALRLSGLDPAGIFLGKAAAIAVELLVLEVLLVLGVIVLYEATIGQVVLLLATCVAATAGFATATTIYGVLALGLRIRETLLPLLAVPVVAPILLAASRATETAFNLSTANGWNWVGLLAVVAVVYTAVGIAAFGPLLEDE